MEGVFIKSYLGKVVARFINKKLYSTFGYEPQVKVLSMSLDAGETVRADVSLEMSKEDFDKLMEEIAR